VTKIKINEGILFLLYDRYRKSSIKKNPVKKQTQPLPQLMARQFNNDNFNGKGFDVAEVQKYQQIFQIVQKYVKIKINIS
jgi:hypothetical protein